MGLKEGESTERAKDWSQVSGMIEMSRIINGHDRTALYTFPSLLVEATGDSSLIRPTRTGARRAIERTDEVAWWSRSEPPSGVGWRLDTTSHSVPRPKRPLYFIQILLGLIM